MSYIIVENLVKHFQIAKRKPGLLGAFKGVVHRKYKIIKALDEISFSIEPGELVGFIGPNGAGKSTTVKILAGILIPNSGRCVVMGRIPWKERVANVRNIGVVFGQRTQLWWDLPVIESFELLKEIYRIPNNVYKNNTEELITLLSLTEILNTPVRQLSLGQRMRCDLVASLLHSPSLLFLDEPTIGLDAVSKLVVRDFIERMNKEQGTTIILATHDMDDIETLCKRIILINHGKILHDGPLEKLRVAMSDERQLIVDMIMENYEIDDPDAKVIRRDGHRVYLRFNPNKVSTAELIKRIIERYPIHDLFVENPPIEEIIAKVYLEQDQL